MLSTFKLDTMENASRTRETSLHLYNVRKIRNISEDVRKILHYYICITRICTRAQERKIFQENSALKYGRRAIRSRGN